MTLLLHRLFWLPVALIVMDGCSSSSKKEEGKEKAAGKSEDLSRFMDKGFDKKKGKFNENVRSRYDQQTFSADKTIADRRFKTDAFNGKSSYKGAHEYKAKEFAQADKKSREETHGFKDSDKKPRESGKAFDAKESRFSDDKAREGDKSFAQHDKKFKTRMVSDAAKSQKKNAKPLIIPKEGEDGKTAYTEEEVRRMVNRN